MTDTYPFRKEFRLIVLSKEPLGDSDLELMKDALATASEVFSGENDGFSEQSWLLVDGEAETDLNKLQ